MSPLILYLLSFIVGVYIGLSYTPISPIFYWGCISALFLSVIGLLYIRKKRLLLDYRTCRFFALLVLLSFAICFADIRSNESDIIKNCEQEGYSLNADSIQCTISSILLSEGIEEQNMALLDAILLGNRDHLNASQIDAFRKTGTMHILVVSGMHVALIFLAIKYLFALLGLYNKNWVKLLSVALIWGYAFLTGAAPSVCRASLMISAAVILPIINARIESRDAVYISLFSLLLYDPTLIYSYSLWLSFISVYALLQSSNLISSISATIPFRIVRYAVRICLVSCVCQIATAPIILSFNDQFPTLFAVNNIVIVPLLTPTLILSCLAILMPHCIAQHMAYVANMLLSCMDHYTQYAQSWHLATIPLPGYSSPEIVLLTICIILFFTIIGTRKTIHYNICGWLFCLCLISYICTTIYLDIPTTSSQNDRVIIWRRYNNTNITISSNNSLTHFLMDTTEKYSTLECNRLKRELRASNHTILPLRNNIKITMNKGTLLVYPNGIVSLNDSLIDIQISQQRRIDIK
ncbi:MAG: ComEC/Rec2 family competence protein [Bacteroidia bacterium]|nr:ComEC/Rec2 family competence protein [Bacteroidia bacterium]